MFPPPSERQVNSAVEVMEHGLLSRIIQSRAMRRKGVTTHVNRKYRLYPYSVQKLLISAHLITDYTITVLHSNFQYREDCGEKFALLPPGLPLVSFSMAFWFRQPHDTSVLWQIKFPSLEETQNVWLLQLPSPDLPLVLPTCASYSHLEHAHAPTQMHSSYQKFWRVIAFSPNVESCTVNWKKPYIHYNRISEHGVGWGVNSCQAQETI